MCAHGKCRVRIGQPVGRQILPHARDQHDIVAGARADVVLVDAENPMDALVRRVPRSLVVAGGRVVDPAELAQHPWE